jgi:hypothetical protein
MKKMLAIIVSLAISYFAAYPVGRLFASKYNIGTGEFFIGSFSGYFDGFALSYIFIAAILVSLISSKIKYGIYSISPFLILALFDLNDPWSRGAFLVAASGLALAWIILFIKKRLSS